MKAVILFLLCLAAGIELRAQVAINADGSVPENSAMLDIKSVSKGLLIPRLTQAQRDAIASPAAGLLVFVTDNSQFYYYNGTAWTSLSSSVSGGWGLAGNAGTRPVILMLKGKEIRPSEAWP